MIEEVQIQTVDEVKNIDYMKETNDIISNQVDKQMENITNLSDTLDSVNSTLNFIAESSGVAQNNDISDVIDTVNNIDTTVIEAQTQDILSIVNKQQNKINNIELTIDEINEKLNQLLEK